MSVSSHSVFPASYAQRRLWFIQQMTPASTAYNMVFSTPLPERPDRNALEWALRGLAQRHENLRTCFRYENEQLLQVISDQPALAPRVLDLPGREELEPILARCAGEPFDLSRAPLARVIVANLEGSRSVLALVIHHIVADGTTLRILLDDLSAIYRARIGGEIVVLPELPIEYADYAVWQRRSLQGPRLEKLKGYWRERLQGLPDLDLPQDRPRPADGSVKGGVVPLRIAAETAMGLRILASSLSTTVFAVLLAGFSVMLARFSGQQSFAIGIPVSTRNRVELERVAGLFVNSLVFRAEVDTGVSFATLAQQVSRALSEDLSHQDLPFELVVDAVGCKRRADRNPLFQVMFQLQVLPERAAAADTDDEPRLDPEHLTSQLDMSFILRETSDGQLSGGAVFATELFDPETIERFVQGYLLILGEGSRTPPRAVGELPVLTARARERILELGHGEARTWPSPGTLPEWWDEVARGSPDAVAIEAADEVLDTKRLDERSGRVAALLQELGVAPGAVVAICLPRSPELVVTVLGVVKAGAAYLVLDPFAPARRLEFIVNDCDAAAVFVADGRPPWAAGRRVLAAGDGENGEHVFHPVSCSPLDPAYAIYTSGSTGQPKGVLISHAALVNHMRWMLETFPLGADDRVLQRTPLTFDAAVWEVWAPLLSPAVMVLAPQQSRFDPDRTVELIQRHRVTVLQVVPSLLRALLERPGMANCDSLRRVFCGGEVLNADVRDLFFSRLRAQLCNLYGPTETTIDATFHVCERDAARATVPIGRPIANVTVRVLDERLQPVPLGVVGELCIGGAATGLGYIGSPELTAERFLDDPWRAGGKLFRTGDRVRMLRTGELHFVGRADDQIKLRGYRIELGEIEAMLLAHPEVVEAAVVVHDGGESGQRLVGWVAPAGSPTGDLAAELTGWLRSRLPAYEVPSAIGVYEELPRNAHGKIDRQALSLLPWPGNDRGAMALAPRNALEQVICSAFGTTLGLEVGNVGIDDDFFLLGGHSLLVISMCDSLSQATGARVGVVDLFEYPTPRQLADALAARMLSRDGRVSCHSRVRELSTSRG